MLKRVLPILGLVVALVLALSLAACSKKTDTQAQKEAPPPAVEQAEQADQAAPAAVPAADSTAATATDVAAAHDCAGGCGMTAVPEAQMTEIDGKWYCAGCAKGLKHGAHHPG